MRSRSAAMGATMLFVAHGPALAHVTLEQQEAAAGSTYKAVLRSAMAAKARRPPPSGCASRTA